MLCLFRIYSRPTPSRFLAWPPLIEFARQRRDRDRDIDSERTVAIRDVLIWLIWWATDWMIGNSSRWPSHSWQRYLHVPLLFRSVSFRLIDLCSRLESFALARWSCDTTRFHAPPIKPTNPPTHLATYLSTIPFIHVKNRPDQAIIACDRCNKNGYKYLFLTQLLLDRRLGPQNSNHQTGLAKVQGKCFFLLLYLSVLVNIQQLHMWAGITDYITLAQINLLTL